MKKLYLLFLIALLSGCRAYTLLPVNDLEQPGNEIVYIDGEPYIASKKQNSKLIAKINVESNGFITTTLMLVNNSKYSVNFFPRYNIEFIGKNEDGKEKYLNIIPANKFISDRERDESIAHFARGVSDSYARRGSGISMTTTYNSDGTSSYSKTYDSSRASLLTEIDTLKNNQIHKEKMTEIDYLSNYLIRDTTLLPKESKFGLVKIDYDNSFSNRYVLKVTIGQDTHILKFKKPYRKLN
jgi:hypothetical protein